MNDGIAGTPASLGDGSTPVLGLVMDRLLSAMAIFVEYPALAAVVGAVLVGLGRHRQRRVAIGVGVAWLLYALYEFGMKQRWLCSGECNIRIDLLAIYPALLIGLVAAGVSLLRPSGRTSIDAG